jgi:hypothetical protein
VIIYPSSCKVIISFGLGSSLVLGSRDRDASKNVEFWYSAFFVSPLSGVFIL